MLSFVFFCTQASAKCKYLFYRRIYSTNVDCFVVDSLCLHLTFEAFSVICKQKLKNITTMSTNQSSSGQILDRLYITSRKFLQLRRKFSNLSPAARSEGDGCFSRLKEWQGPISTNTVLFVSLIKPQTQ